MHRLYKHINNTDIAFEIIKSFFVREKQVWKFRVIWWNIGKCHEPWCMNISERITLTRDSWENEWKLYDRD